MRSSKSSVLKLGGRKPYEPISRLTDLPPAIFEMATLIEQGISGDLNALKKASALQESIITVMLDNPTCVQQIRNLLSNGYAIEFSVKKRASENPQFSEELSPITT
jgi:hypothetical protein